MRRVIALTLALCTGLVPTPAAGGAGCDQGTWVIEPSANADTSTELLGIGGVADDDVWAVGWYRRDTGEDAPLAQHWNGSTWSEETVPGDLAGILQDVEASATDDAWAVGSILTPAMSSRAVAFHWNGYRWARVAVPKPQIGPLVSTVFTDVAVVAPDDVWAVGRWSPVPDAPASTLVEHWDGESWQVVATPPLEGWHEFRSVSANAPDDVWAVGGQTFRAETYLTERALIEHWNGRRWRVVRSPVVATRLPFTLEAVDARTRRDAWAVGQLTRGARTRTIAFRWDGERWSEVPVPDPSQELQLLGGVASVARDRAFAVGQYLDADRRERTLVLRWDGENWRQVPSESRPDGNLLYDVIAFPSRHFAVGSFWADGGDGPQRTLVLRPCGP